MIRAVVKGVKNDSASLWKLISGKETLRTISFDSPSRNSSFEVAITGCFTIENPSTFIRFHRIENVLKASVESWSVSIKDDLLKALRFRFIDFSMRSNPPDPLTTYPSLGKPNSCKWNSHFCMIALNEISLTEREEKKWTTFCVHIVNCEKYSYSYICSCHAKFTCPE